MFIRQKIYFFNYVSQVTTEEGKAFADFHDISFIETSSKSTLYVQEAFALIAREIYDLLIEGRIRVQKGYVYFFYNLYLNDSFLKMGWS